MDIKVLGPGCPKCKITLKHVHKALEKVNRDDVTVTKVETMEEIMKYNIMSTPALVINEEIKILGRVATVKEIIGLIEENKTI